MPESIPLRVHFNVYLKDKDRFEKHTYNNTIASLKINGNTRLITHPDSVYILPNAGFCTSVV